MDSWKIWYACTTSGGTDGGGTGAGAGTGSGGAVTGGGSAARATRRRIGAAVIAAIDGGNQEAAGGVLRRYFHTLAGAQPLPVERIPEGRQLSQRMPQRNHAVSGCLVHGDGRMRAALRMASTSDVRTEPGPTSRKGGHHPRTCAPPCGRSAPGGRSAAPPRSPTIGIGRVQAAVEVRIEGYDIRADFAGFQKIAKRSHGLRHQGRMKRRGDGQAGRVHAGGSTLRGGLRDGFPPSPKAPIVAGYYGWQSPRPAPLCNELLKGKTSCRTESIPPGSRSGGHQLAAAPRHAQHGVQAACAGSK